METDPKLLEILVCPLTRTTLHYDRDRQELVSKAAGLAYPIRDGVPVLLGAAARALREALAEEYLRVESPSAEVRGHGGPKQIVVGKEAVTVKALEPVGNYAV